MRQLILALCLAGAVPLVVAQQSAFVGSWLLWVESGNQGRPAYGSLVFEPAGDALAVYVEGGRAVLRELDGSRMVFDFDWSELQDRVHMNTMEGRLADGVIEGRALDETGKDRGAWRATPAAAHDFSLPPRLVDMTGIWDRPAIISKHSFDLGDYIRVSGGLGCDGTRRLWLDKSSLEILD